MATVTLKRYADQTAAQKDLSGYVEGSRVTNLSQALNAAYDGKGKDSGKHTVDGVEVQVLHASAGKIGGTSVTLFHFFRGSELHLVALGEHVASDRYLIEAELGQQEAPFRKKKTVGPSGG
ncbi:hypothetical protein [Streptantibioticus cattleyicolor]|uniref:Uncharacterized protein n=1 Tax=Streptantibioticus cattleyicolor (strain ATCC 35852 / DSM 46488 / JCM 4925 / NBRC 14057 / NRRL 8057) TaxID=1003195 RepID=F8JMV6_STREN|nr:hypothetical protein [Streptantibioticus cattleyicolor]AEW99250.1 hypothetical protein SCATT_p10570 [Streptantibioticus cattleyicolor NRRL 8057 = DSM 46488]CCB71707.1 protein of unknown function [Streptantibioticus cattleyicolor NRRL 8057 = DSM 46488]